MQRITFTREVKQQWITALRSGDFKQTAGQLHSRNIGGYCCLGVLAELNGIIDGEGRCTLGDWSGNGYLTAIQTDADRDMPTLIEGLSADLQLDLASRNDAGKSFDEIADFIEKNVPAVDEE